MSIEYDAKGKYFTNVVTKEAIPAIIQTLTHRINGCVHVRQGERLKDELDNATEYLAITEAEVLNDAGDVLYRSSFLVLNRDHIVWVIPVAELSEPPVEAGESK